MRNDKRLTMVHALAQGLLTHHMTGGRLPIVIRTDDPHIVVGTLRTVAAAADYSVRGYPTLPTGKDAADLPVRHVVIRQGRLTPRVADEVVALGREMPEDALIALILPARDKESMQVLGVALQAAGLVERDEELEPRQTVPSVEF